VGSGQFVVNSKCWALYSVQWTVISGRCAMERGQVAVRSKQLDSGQWIVKSGQIAVNIG
jgi:hypothetical protein